MRRLVLLLVACFSGVSALSQTPQSNEALLAKTRALYDTPFTRNLASFDCAVEFDWTKHLTGQFPQGIPSGLVPTASRLQAVQHRVSVDRFHVTVSSTPESPDFAGDGRATMLEHALNGMISGGLQAWQPFSSGTFFPAGPTKYDVAKAGSGYKITIRAPAITTTVLLDAQLRVISGVSGDMRFVTRLVPGPNGLLLASVLTEPTGGTGRAAAFAFTYQTVDGIQLPSEVTVSPATTEPFQFALTDCKVVRFVKIQVAPPSEKH